MKRVTDIGGIFFKSPDPAAPAAWYRTHLGLDVEAWGGVAFRWAGTHNPDGTGTTIWSPFAADTAYFAPSTAPFMVSFRVADLHALLAVLRDEGVAVMEKVEESEYGKLGWVMDPDGNKIELWEPPPGQ
jgi:catechol 2,3-dioxygenase-like lactoylglutathione lyase family enzyme